jgi:hypothetical protein
MTDRAVRHLRLLAAALAVLVTVAGCGGAVSIATSSTAPSTQAGTQSSAPSVAPSAGVSADVPALPSASPAADVATGIKIGAPYVLTGNPGNPALSGTFNVDLGGRRIEAIMNGREIRKDGKLAGLVLVMRFTAVPMSPRLFQGAATTAATDAGGKLAYSTILGTHVAFVTSTTATFGLYPRGDSVLMVGGPKGTDAKTLLTSVIKANS